MTKKEIRYCEDCCREMTFYVEDYGVSPVRVDCACGAAWTLEYDEWIARETDDDIEECFSWNLERVDD